MALAIRVIIHNNFYFIFRNALIQTNKPGTTTQTIMPSPELEPEPPLLSEQARTTLDHTSRLNQTFVYYLFTEILFSFIYLPAFPALKKTHFVSCPL